jgi:hypothetical protein
MLVMIRGAYGYTLTLCGYAYRIRGDEWALAPGNRTVFRTGSADMGGFDDLAAKGPRNRYRTSEPAEIKEPLHRLLIFRAKPANVKAWEKVIPRPADWQDE